MSVREILRKVRVDVARNVRPGDDVQRRDQQFEKVADVLYGPGEAFVLILFDLGDEIVYEAGERVFIASGR